MLLYRIRYQTPHSTILAVVRKTKVWSKKTEPPNSQNHIKASKHNNLWKSTEGSFMSILHDSETDASKLYLMNCACSCSKIIRWQKPTISHGLGRSLEIRQQMSSSESHTSFLYDSKQKTFKGQVYISKLHKHNTDEQVGKGM